MSKDELKKGCGCSDHCTCGDECNCNDEHRCSEECTCNSEGCNCGDHCECGDDCNCHSKEAEYLELAQRIKAEFDNYKKRVSKEKENITPEMIIDFFCQRYAVKKDELLGQSRTSQIKSIRHLCIYVIKTLTAENYKSIGKLFNKDRTSIMYSHGQIEKSMNSEKEFARTVDKIIAEIREIAENS